MWCVCACLCVKGSVHMFGARGGECPTLMQLYTLRMVAHMWGYSRKTVNSTSLENCTCQGSGSSSMVKLADSTSSCSNRRSGSGGQAGRGCLGDGALDAGVVRIGVVQHVGDAHGEDEEKEDEQNEAHGDEADDNRFRQVVEGHHTAQRLPRHEVKIEEGESGQKPGMGVSKHWQ